MLVPKLSSVQRLLVSFVETRKGQIRFLIFSTVAYYGLGMVVGGAVFGVVAYSIIRYRNHRVEQGQQSEEKKSKA